jgi:hypothetical protein
MYYYYDCAGNGGYLAENEEYAREKLQAIARRTLIGNPDGEYTACLINFESKDSTIYEFTADFQISCTSY